MTPDPKARRPPPPARRGAAPGAAPVRPPALRLRRRRPRAARLCAPPPARAPPWTGRRRGRSAVSASPPPWPRDGPPAMPAPDPAPPPDLAQGETGCGSRTRGHGPDPATGGAPPGSEPAVALRTPPARPPRPGPAPTGRAGCARRRAAPPTRSAASRRRSGAAAGFRRGPQRLATPPASPRQTLALHPERPRPPRAAPGAR